jgi:hypothetical protein
MKKSLFGSITAAYEAKWGDFNSRTALIYVPV